MHCASLPAYVAATCKRRLRFEHPFDAAYSWMRDLAPPGGDAAPFDDLSRDYSAFLALLHGYRSVRY